MSIPPNGQLRFLPASNSIPMLLSTDNKGTQVIPQAHGNGMGIEAVHRSKR